MWVCIEKKLLEAQALTGQKKYKKKKVKTTVQLASCGNTFPFFIFLLH